MGWGGGGGGGGWAAGVGFEDRKIYINIYRYIDMGRLGSFEIGQRLEIFYIPGGGVTMWEFGDRYQGC